MCIRSMRYFVAFFKKNEAVAIYNIVIGLPELIHGSAVKLQHLINVYRNVGNVARTSAVDV